MKKMMQAIIAVSFFLSFQSCESEKPWQPLFNGQNLDNWDKYIGTPLKGQDSLAALATADNVFTVIQSDGVGLIRISGTVKGSLATKESFGNYHLKMVFRWGDSIYTTRNSGLLYHGTGSFGAALGTWMTCIECQMKNGSLGDTYLMNNSTCETAVLKNDSLNICTYSPGAPAVSFGEQASGHSVKKMTDAERPVGEWNTIELYSVGQTTVHVVNGVTVMVNQQTGLFENGIIKPLTSGRIQLQSEGAELFVKSLEIKPISNIPQEILK